MVCIGEDPDLYCNGKTVGLPSDGNPANLERENYYAWRATPIRKEVYQPILKELEEYGVVFKEQSMTYYGYKPDNTSRY
jgi:hypothetical protein